MKKKIIILCIAVFTFLIALGITLYPMISTWYNERHQAEVHIHYKEKVDQVDNTQLIEAKELAVAYNQTILPGAQDEDSFSKEALLSASENYGNLLNLAGDGIMGYVEIPTIGVTLPIYHGTNNSTLERGVGHLLGSSLPVGGESTHSVLTAHSGMASAKMFSDLDRLENGDIFFLDILGEKLAYQVDQIKTVLPHDTTFLQTEIGSDFCTLVTCTPFGVNTHRLLVRGTRIEYEEAEVIVEEKLETEDPVKSTWEQQYLRGILIGLGAVLVLGLVVVIVWRFRRRAHG